MTSEAEVSDLELTAGGQVSAGPAVVEGKAVVLLRVTEPGAPVAVAAQLSTAEVTVLRQALKQARSDALVARDRDLEAARQARREQA